MRDPAVETAEVEECWAKCRSQSLRGQRQCFAAAMPLLVSESFAF